MSKTAKDNDGQELGRMMGELQGHLNFQLLAYVLQGDAVRKLKEHRQKALGVQAIGGNELKSELLMQAGERLEKLIRDGHCLSDALDQMRHEDWLNRILNFTFME